MKVVCPLVIVSVLALTSCDHGVGVPPAALAGSSLEAAARPDTLHVIPFFQFQRSNGYTPLGTPGGRHGLVGSAALMYGSAPAGGDDCPANKINGCGVIYKLTQTKQSSYIETILVKFNETNGAVPYASVSFDPSGGSNIYGTTFDGGKYGNGTVFVLQPSGKTYRQKIIHSFGNKPDGAHPFAGVNIIDGVLYGTTVGGGRYTNPLCKSVGRSPDETCGTVYKIDLLHNDAESVIHNFGAAGDGASPYGGITYDKHDKSVLYGTTVLGGHVNASCGTVYRLTLPSGNEQILYDFAGAPDGCRPYAGVYADLSVSHGYLYGTTSRGGFGMGDTSGGTIFRVNIAMQSEDVLYRFGAFAGDGLQPDGFLHHVNGTFYGTTSLGGGSSDCTGGCGTVFSIATTGANYRQLHVFDGGKGGTHPTGGLLYSQLNGSFYGTTSAGGRYDRGAGFKLGP